MKFKIKNEFKGANISHTIRFPEKLYEELQKQASENSISFNLLVLQCCQYALNNLDDEPETR